MSIDNVKNEIVKAPLFKRIGVAITDIFFLFFLFLIFNTYILSPIVVATTSYTQITEEYKKVMLDSNLYILDDGSYLEIIDTYDEEK